MKQLKFYGYITCVLLICIVLLAEIFNFWIRKDFVLVLVGLMLLFLIVNVVNVLRTRSVNRSFMLMMFLNLFVLGFYFFDVGFLPRDSNVEYEEQQVIVTSSIDGWMSCGANFYLFQKSNMLGFQKYELMSNKSCFTDVKFEKMIDEDTYQFRFWNEYDEEYKEWSLR